MQIREMIGFPPNLPPCLGVTSHILMAPHPHSSLTISPASVIPLSEYHSVVEGENEIPYWFNHQSNGNSISFLIGPEIPTIALCVAIEIIEDIMEDDGCDFNYHVVILINGIKRLFESREYENIIFGPLVFCCRPQSSLQKLFEDLNLGDLNHVQIFCETSQVTERIVPVITRVAVHVECICPPKKSGGCQISKRLRPPLPLDDGFDLGSSSLTDDSDFSPYPQSKKMRPP